MLWERSQKEHWARRRMFLNISGEKITPKEHLGASHPSSCTLLVHLDPASFLKDWVIDYLTPFSRQPSDPVMCYKCRHWGTGGQATGLRVPRQQRCLNRSEPRSPPTSFCTQTHCSTVQLGKMYCTSKSKFCFLPRAKGNTLHFSFLGCCDNGTTFVVGILLYFYWQLHSMS